MDEESRAEQNMMNDEKMKHSKAGVRILSAQDDLFRLFMQDEARDAEDDHDRRLMTEALAAEDMERVLWEKERLSIRKPLRIKDVIRQYPPPEAEIDLHGCSAPQAVERLAIFIQNARRQNLKTVRIIVGKGLHSNDKAILPDIVEKQLALFKKQQVVIWFQWEKREKRKSGALVAYLPFAKPVKRGQDT